MCLGLKSLGLIGLRLNCGDFLTKVLVCPDLVKLFTLKIWGVTGLLSVNLSNNDSVNDAFFFWFSYLILLTMSFNLSNQWGKDPGNRKNCSSWSRWTSWRTWDTRQSFNRGNLQYCFCHIWSSSIFQDRRIGRCMWLFTYSAGGTWTPRNGCLS